MNAQLKHPTAGIILAAGMSRRFGSPKQLLKIDDIPVIHLVLNNSLNSRLDAVALVLGHESEKIIASCGEFRNHPKLRIYRNENYRDGMATSLHEGIKNLDNEFPSVMFLLGDQPFINTTIINTLLDHFRNSDKDICVPVINGKRANPVIFSRKFYSAIMEIKGDIGAREIIDKNPDYVHHVEFDKNDYFFDIDNQEDFDRLKQK